MHYVHVRALARCRRRYLIGPVLAAAIATIHLGTVAYAFDGVFPVVLTDRSCQDVGSAQSATRTDCNPDAPALTQSDSQVQSVAVAQNFDAPDSAVAANENQDAPISQFP